MADAQRPPGAANVQQQPAQAGGLGFWGRLVVQYLLITIVMRYFTGFLSGSPTLPGTPVSDGLTDSASLPTQAACLWAPRTPMSLSVFFFDQPMFTETWQSAARRIWSEAGLVLEDVPANSRSVDLALDISDAIARNESRYLHVFLSTNRFPRAASESADTLLALNPSACTFDDQCFHFVTPVLIHRLLRKKAEKRNLLSSASSSPASPSSDDVAGEANKGDWIAEDSMAEADPGSSQQQQQQQQQHWIPSVFIQTVADLPEFPRSTLAAAPLKSFVHTDPVSGFYYPITFSNDFWVLLDSLWPLNSSVSIVPLHLEYQTIGTWRFTFYAQMMTAGTPNSATGGSFLDSLHDEDSKEETKRMFLEADPYLLALTMVVSLLHMVFEMLAFKNDISFWKNNKSMEGLSLRSLFLNVGTQVIVLLYLLDNETNWMILLGSGIGLLIECWKISKATHIRIDRTAPLWKMIRFQELDSYSKTRTKEFDEIATTWLMYAMVPLIIAYSVYSLFSDSYKSWYSFVLTVSVRFIVAFGFVMMTPQLWINYKLKSVAHMPWRQMVYKFLNTIVDDLGSFLIKMPTLHRLSYFRDDVIFLIFLYQRWIYPVDASRANEFGYVEQPGAGALSQLPEAAAASGGANHDQSDRHGSSGSMGTSDGSRGAAARRQRKAAGNSLRKED